MGINFKKAISPVVATALLLVVAVVAVVGFSNWYQTYQSSMTSKLEQSDPSINSVNIGGIVDNILYIKNSNSGNISLNKIKIGGIDCNISGNYSGKIISINVSSCLNNLISSVNNIVVFTSSKIISKTQYVSITPLPSPCSLDGITLNSGEIHVFYNKTKVLYGESCSNYNLIRSCNDGVLNGSSLFNHSSCIVSLSNFVTKWDVSIDPGVSGYDNLTLPLQSNGDSNFTVYWGDCTSSKIESWDSVNKFHKYSNGGVYIVIIDGKIKEFAFNEGISSDDNQDDGDKLIDILQWGNLTITTASEMFSNCENLVNFTATDTLNLS